MARYYWIKLKESFFQNKHIKKLRKLPGGADYVIAYMKMMLISTETRGIIAIEGIEDTPEEELALIIDETKETCQMTLAYGLKSGLIVPVNGDNYPQYKMLEVEGLLDSESSDAERKRYERSKSKELLLTSGPQDNSFRQRKFRAKKWCLKHLPSMLGISDLENNRDYQGQYYIVLRDSKGICSICGGTATQVYINGTTLQAICSDCLKNIRENSSSLDSNNSNKTNNISRNASNETSNTSNVTYNKSNVIDNKILITSNKKTDLLSPLENRPSLANTEFMAGSNETDIVRTKSLDIDIDIDIESNYNSIYNSNSIALEYYQTRIGKLSSEDSIQKLLDFEKEYSFSEIQYAIDIAWSQHKGSIGYIQAILENERKRKELIHQHGGNQTYEAVLTQPTQRKQTNRLDGPDWDNLEPGKL